MLKPKELLWIFFIALILAPVLWFSPEIYRHFFNKVDMGPEPEYLDGYGVTTNYVCVSSTNALNSLDWEENPLSPIHRRYVPGDIVPQGLDCDKDYDQRVVSITHYSKSYAELCSAVTRWHLPLPQKLTVDGWYAEGIPYMRVPHKFPCTMDEFAGKQGRRWIVVKCSTTFNGCYSANIFEISDGDPRFENLVPGSTEFVAMCYRYSHSVDANVNQDIYRSYKLVDRDRDFFFHRYKIDCDGLWITQGALKFPGVRDRSSWRTSQKWYMLWRLRNPEPFN